jgi:hypothetical protein
VGPTNSMAVRRMESASENMIHQNIQSFGTPWERPSEGSGEEDLDGGEPIQIC